MGQVVQTNGDYLIRTGESKTITLDTGLGVGEVIVTGNLEVRGTTITVDAEQFNVKDNIVTLNDGEQGNGVSLGESGLQIDRGLASNAFFLYDENIDSFVIANGFEGSYSFSDSALRLRYLTTDADTDNGDLSIDAGGGSGLIKVINTGGNYKERLIAVDDDNTIPNKKYVDDAIRDNPTFQVVDNNTRVIVTEKDAGFFDAFNPAVDVSDPLNDNTSERYLNDQTGFTSYNGESSVSVIVDANLTAQFFTNRLEIGLLEIGGGEDRNVITIKDGITNENLYIRTPGTGKTVFNYAIQLEKLSLSPARVADHALLHAGPVDIGKTGIYFVNDSINTGTNNDDIYQTGELISKNKALVFSMLF